MRQAGWNPWLGQVALAGSRKRLGDLSDLNDDSFSDALSGLSVVDFWSPSCAPCLRYKPTFMDVASQVQGVFMATANADESHQTMAQYGIDSIPTTLFFVNGQEVNRLTGVVSREDLLAAISKMTPSTAGQEMIAPPPGSHTKSPTVTRPQNPPPTGVPQQAPATYSTPSAAKPSQPSVTTPPASTGPSTTLIFVGGFALLALGAGAILLSGRA